PVQPDTTAVLADREGQLGAIVVRLLRRHQLGIGDLEVRQPPKRVADDRAPRRALGVEVEVLHLAAAAFVSEIMGTAGLDPVRPGLDYPADPRASEALVLPDGGELDQVARGAAGDEHGAF